MASQSPQGRKGGSSPEVPGWQRGEKHFRKEAGSKGDSGCSGQRGLLQGQGDLGAGTSSGDREETGIKPEHCQHGVI